MPFRIVLVLIGEIGAAILALIRPYFGLLCLVFVTFGRPQGDRPNIVALHVPMVLVLSIAVGTLIRMGSVTSAFLAALKRLWLILVFFGLMGFSAAASYTPYAAGRLDEFTTVIFLCLLTLGWVATPKQLNGYIMMLLLSAVYLIQTGLRNPRNIVEEIGGQTFTRLNLARSSEFGQTNYLALFMVLTIFLSISLLSMYRSAWQRAGLLLLMGASSLIFFRAQSRGATLACAAGLIFLWFVQKHKLRTAVIGLVLIGAGALMAPQEYWQRLATIQHYQEDASAMGRLELWQVALQLIEDHPVLGVGPDNFILYATNTPHNAYLQVGCELGLPAMLMYIVILMSGLYSAWRARRLSAPEVLNEPYLYAMSRGILACLLAIVVQGFTTGLAHREFVYVFVTLGYCLHGLAEKAASEQKPAIALPEQPTPEPAVDAFQKERPYLTT